MGPAEEVEELTSATLAFLEQHAAALRRAGGDASRAGPVVRALLEGLDDPLHDRLQALDAAHGVRPGPPDGLPGAQEAESFLAGDPAVAAAWASRAVRQARHQALLALAGLDGTLQRMAAAAAKGAAAGVDPRRAAGGEIRVLHALDQLAEALTSWDRATRALLGAPAPPPRALPAGELLLRAREALAAGMPERAALRAREALAARFPRGVPPRYAPLAQALAAGDPTVTALALLDGVEAALREG